MIPVVEAESRFFFLESTFFPKCTLFLEESSRLAPPLRRPPHPPRPAPRPARRGPSRKEAGGAGEVPKREVTVASRGCALTSRRAPPPAAAAARIPRKGARLPRLPSEPPGQ
nr:unnamed protein product [Digitaria exilis]